MAADKAPSTERAAAHPEPSSTRWIRVGKLGRPHGLRGEVRVFTDVADSDSLQYAGELLLQLPDGSAVTRRIERRRRADRYWILSLTGCADRDQAAALTGAICLVDRAELPAMEPDTYYACDLIGLAVFDPDGACLGEVVEVFDNGAHDVLVYRAPAGPEHMIPFTDAFVPTVDVAAGRIVIEAVTVADEGGGEAAP